MNSLSERTQIYLSSLGAFLILLFLMLPIAPGTGRGEEAEPSIFLVSAKGEQWGFLILAPLAARMVYTGALGAALGALVGLFLCALSAMVRPIISNNPRNSAYDWYWYEFVGPGFLHLATFFAGFALLSVAVISGWRQVYGRRTTIQLGSQSAAKPTTTPSNPAKPIQSSRMSFGDLLSAIDWGWWGIAVISLLAWPLGLLLYFAYSRTGDDKGGAALIGAGLGLVLMALRFVFIMSRVGA